MTRNLWYMAFGQGISQVGDRIYLIALMWWTLDKTGSSAIMGLVALCGQIPVVFLGPIAGYAADVLNRRRILIVTDVMRGVITLALSALLVLGRLEVWILLIATVLLNGATAFFTPACQAMVPEIVDKPRLPQANALTQFAGDLAGTCGPFVGGFMYTAMRAAPMFLVNALSFFAGAWSSFMIKYPRRGHEGGARRFTAAGVFRDMGRGLAAVVKYPGVKETFFLIAFLNFFSHSSINLLLPVYVKKALGASAALCGVALSAFAVGSTVAIALQSAIAIGPRVRYILFISCLVVQSLCRTTLGVVVDPTYTVVVFAVTGFANSFINIGILTMLQLAIPAELQGKAFGVIQTLCWGLTPAAYALFGILGDIYPTPGLLLWANAASIVVSLGYLVLPATRRMFGAERGAAA